jgi:hypothetical protein
MVVMGGKDLPKRRMLIDPSTRNAIRTRKVLTEELDLLWRRASLWTKAHLEELSDDECQDLISAALLEVYPLILDPTIEDVEVDLDFRRALGTRRTAEKRRVRRFASIDKIDQLIGQAADPADSEEGFLLNDHLLRVAKAVKNLIAIAVDLMPGSSRDLIVMEYNLIPFGYAMRDPESVTTQDGRYRVALFRARKRFLQILATVYDAAQTALRGDPALLKISVQEAGKLAKFSEPGQSALLDAAELLQLVCAAKGFIGLSVDLLPDREHDCIVEYYNLERFGLSLRGPATRGILKNPNSKIARRAHLVFMETFEAVLAAAQVALGNDRNVIEQALKLVRGEDVPGILEVIGELEAKVYR